MSLVFKKIESGEIFTRDFNPLVQNNEITFPTTEEIVVIYGPNGTGKTSLIRVLADTQNTRVQFSLNDTEYNRGSEIFHIINDQNNRNIISGKTSDFFLGDNIRKEVKLQEQILVDRNVLLSSILDLIKNTFNISAGNSPLIDLLSKKELIAFIKDCANSRSKGKHYTTEKLVELLQSLTFQHIPKYDSNKLAFLQRDWGDKSSIIKQIEALVGADISPNIHVYEIEENTEAIKILSRFHRDKCIVCDSEGINWSALLKAKTDHRQTTLEALDKKIKEAIEKAIPFVPTSDPFNIKTCLLNATASGDTEGLTSLFK